MLAAGWGAFGAAVSALDGGDESRTELIYESAAPPGPGRSLDTPSCGQRTARW